MSRYQISDIGFEPDGTALITYMERTDLRCEGQVAVRHTARIVPSAQYAEGIQALVDAALNLLADALEDWHESAPVDIDDMAGERPLEDDDDEELESAAARRNWAGVEASRGGL